MSSSYFSPVSSNHKRQEVKNEGLNFVDRISNLPDSVLCYILSFLPTKETVGTSILSRKWRFIWTEIPCLEFDDFEWCYGDITNHGLSLAQIISRVLLLHNSKSLDKFKIQCVGNSDPFYINTWISSVIAKNLRKLELICLSSPSKIMFPSTLFASGTLESLSLWGSLEHHNQGVMVLNPPSFVSLPKLVTLNLDSVWYETRESLHRLLSGCPILEYLSIRRNHYDNVSRFVISSPSLKHLQVSFVSSGRMCIRVPLPKKNPYKLEINTPSVVDLILSDMKSQDFMFRDLTSLVEAKVSLGGVVISNDYYNSVLNVVQALSHAKSLIFSRRTPEALGKATTSLSARFDKLTELVVESNCCEWSSLQDFLNRSNNLEALNFIGDGYPPYETWRKPDGVPECLLSSLKEVSVSKFVGSAEELAVIKFILQHGGVLKRLQINVAKDRLDSRKRSRMLQKISTFPRKSDTCEIGFTLDG